MNNSKIHNKYPSYNGCALSEEEGTFGYLTASTDLLSSPELLRDRMKRDGYLYLPGLLNRAKVEKARSSIIEKMRSQGMLDEHHDPDLAVARKDLELSFQPELAQGNPEVEELLYTGEMLGFFEAFLGGEVLHFDFTWLRARGPGASTATPPHCDTVFMNRGTSNLFTAWTPLGRIPFDLGGLMILEGSHLRDDILHDYWRMDVDVYCQNGDEAEEIMSGKRKWQSDRHSGFFDEDAIRLRDQMGGRWLGAVYNPGDVLVFGMYTIHAASDNHTDRVRLSTDSRYQLASEPADERWIGPHPVGHGPEGKKGMIC